MDNVHSRIGVRHSGRGSGIHSELPRSVRNEIHPHAHSKSNFTQARVSNPVAGLFEESAGDLDNEGNFFKLLRHS